MKSYFQSIVAAVLVCVVALPLFAEDKVDVNGTWEMTFDSPRGSNTREMVMVQDGDKVTISTIGRDGESVSFEATLEGSTISWSQTQSRRGREISLTFIGTVDGDSMQGEMEVPRRGTYKWSGKKKVE
jgi:hypothetical protein